MIDFRKIILDELERQGRSKYWLAENPGCGVAKNVVYLFLRGESDGSAQTLAAMFGALRLQIVPDPKVPADKAPAGKAKRSR